jgi:hypothetical protein
VNGVKTDLDWYFAAIFALTKEFAPGTHGPSCGIAKVIMPVIRMVSAEAFRNKHLDRLANEFIPSVAKEGFDPFVD